MLAERLRGPELLRGRVEVPAGTNTLADMFWRNISASGCVPPGTSVRRNKSAMTPAQKGVLYVKFSTSSIRPSAQHAFHSRVT